MKNRSSNLKVILAAILSAGAIAPAVSPSDTSASRSVGPSSQFQRAKTDQKLAQAPAPASGQAIRIVRGLDGNTPTSLFFPGGGCPPDIWGKSRACARMVRKNRLRRIGLGGDKI